MKVFTLAIFAVVLVAFVAAEEDKTKLEKDGVYKKLFQINEKTKPSEKDGEKSKPLDKDGDKSKRPMEMNDELSEAIDTCLDNLDLGDKEELTDEENYCLFGCLLHHFNLIDEDGKLMKNGLEEFLKSIPAKYLADFPNLSKDLTAILPKLQKTKSTCEAGKIARNAVGELFYTDFY